MLENKNDLSSCCMYYAFSAIGGKWKPFIIWYLYASPTGTCRYGELKRKMPWDISSRMFTLQLRELERDNIIIRREYDEKPLRVEYCLSEEGKLLVPAILYLRDWGAVFSDKFGPEVLKRSLGTFEKDTINYSCFSEQIGKGVSVRFVLNKTDE